MCISIGIHLYIQGDDSECESHKTCSARSTHRKREREESIHTLHRLIETLRQIDKECARGRPRLLLVKRQGWGFTLGTWMSKTQPNHGQCVALLY